MWCYQKPGFEALLLAELQKQQQNRQYCDTMLKAEGVSVPAHSCLLSAVSPQIFSALSTTPVPPAGQMHLLEFQTVGARTLLHMVRLLYSGEMAGEGDEEKQEAISVAAKLGIHGLVEVTKKDHRCRNEDREGQHAEVGVQTEVHVPEKSRMRQGRWRMEVREGSALLCKDILSDGQKDECTQTEDLDINTALSTHPTTSLKTIDVGVLNSLRQTDSFFVPPNISFAPISLVYQSDGNETTNPYSHPTVSIQDSTTAVAVVAPPYSSVAPPVHLSSNQMTLCAADPQSQPMDPAGADTDVVASEEWDDEPLEQFQGNIPGFIDYFLNPDHSGQGSCRRQAGRRRRARVRGAKNTGTSVRKPTSRARGRRRGRLMEIVDVQDVGVSKEQKSFLLRGGVLPSRSGQGGGTVGRKLHLKTRESLKQTRSYRRRGRCSKTWELSQTGDMPPFSERKRPVTGQGRGGGRGSGRGGGNKPCEERNSKQQFQQAIPPAVRAKPTTSFSLSSPPVPLHSGYALSGSSPSLQSSLRPNLLLPVAAYTSPAVSVLHTTSIPPTAPPSHEEQPEHIDQILEEVMMGLDILTNNSAAEHSDPLDQNCSNSLTFLQNSVTQNNHNQSNNVLKACSGASESAELSAVAESDEMPFLQQQEVGELTDILDHFLQSFEQQMSNCGQRENKDMGGKSSAKPSKPYSALSKYSKTKPQTITSQTDQLKNKCRLQATRRCQPTKPQQSLKAEKQSMRSQTCKNTSYREVQPQEKKKGTRQYRLSLEKKKKNPVTSSGRKPRTCSTSGDKRLQQRPVVRLERSDPTPIKIELQARCQSGEVKVTKTQNPTKPKSSSSSVKSSSDKKQPSCFITKTYPIRSRLKETTIMDSVYVAPALPKQWGRGCRSKKNGQFPSSSNGGSPTPDSQSLPVESCCVEEQSEKRCGRHEEALNVQSRDETGGPLSRGHKRRIESEEETSDDATVVKKVCIGHTAQLTTEPPIPSSDSADSTSKAENVEVDNVIDVETVSVSSDGDYGQRDKGGQKTLWSKILLTEIKDSSEDEETECDSDETINVDGGSDGITDWEEWAEKGCCKSRTAAGAPYFVSHLEKRADLVLTGCWEDEDIDVTGGSSPLPDPVVISWTESSGHEEEDGDEDIDVSGEMTDCASLLL